MALLRKILKQLALHPRRAVMVDDRRTWTGITTLGAAFHLAKVVNERTDRPRVGVLLPTSGAFGAAVLGVWQAGRVPVPLNYLLKPEDLRYVIENAELDVVLTAGPMLEFLSGDGWLPEGVALVKLETLDFKGVPPVRWPAKPEDDDLGLLLYTSGTSGKPKGVMLSHGNLDANVHQAIEHSGVTERESFISVLPQFHTFGITVLTLMPLRLGSKVVYTARFNPKKVIDLIREHRPNVFIAIPSMFNALLNVKSATAEDWQSLTHLVAGGEKLQRSVAERFEAKFERQLLEGYGLTETSPVTHWNTAEHPRPGSVGTALPGVETLVLDEGGAVLPQGSEGEVALGGPNLMQGYFKSETQTAEAIVEVDVPGRAGRLRVMKTGDIGRVDADGFLYITGRKKELIIIGGENVAPTEIEEVLDEHPKVLASAVVARADESRGEVAVAFVELQDGESVEDGELRAWCRERLASAKVPREVTVIDTLPRNPTGKIMRRALVGQAGGAATDDAGASNEA